MKDEITRRLLEDEQLSDIPVMTLIRVMTVLQEIIVSFEKLNEVFKPTTKMQEKWDKSHEEYVEKSAWIKTMLAM